MKSYVVGLIPGDGIGPELIDAAVTVLNAAATGRFTLDFRWEDGGAGTYLRTGSNLSAEALTRIQSVYHATLKGPAGLPEVRSPDGTEAGVLGGVLRRGLDAYANIRPVRHPGAGIDYVLVRENTEGLYASRDAGVGNDWAHTDQLLVTRPGTERIVRRAFELARARGGAPTDGVRRVTCVDKSNVLRSYALFRRIFTEIAAEYPDIEADYLYADAAAYQLITCPGRFDVLVTENFIGDILSDVAAATVGGLGLCPAANIGCAAAYFEPAHGSAPSLAGTDSANPTAQILAAAMLLEFLGEHAGAHAILTAVDAVVLSAIPKAGSAQCPTGSLRHTTSQICEHISRHYTSAAPHQQYPAPTEGSTMEVRPTTTNNNILVVGAGAMGSQIAMTAALAGYATTVHDLSRTQLDDAAAALRKRTDKMVQSGKLAADDAEAAHARLQFSTDLEAVAPPADFVIEAATERLDIKREIFATLGHLTPRHAILATNSSTLGSSKVAEASGRPAQVCNMHFFNPALVMECVEVVQHPGTSQATVDTTMSLARSMGKSPVLINREVPGFIANRLMGAVQKEALALLAGGVASKDDIDATAKQALRHPMGPFELMDLVGLDVIDDIARATHAQTGDPADAPNEAVLALVREGKLGRKSGAGWYTYGH